MGVDSGCCGTLQRGAYLLKWIHHNLSSFVITDLQNLKFGIC